MANEAGKEAKQVAGAITSMGIDEMISNLAIGIAKGQMKLDEACMKIAQFMGDAQIDFGKKPGSNLPDQISLMELGFTPNFYQFVDTILEIKVAISSQFEESREFDTSVSQVVQNEHEDHQSYERDSGESSSEHKYDFNRQGNFNWGRGGVKWGYSGSANNSSLSKQLNERTKSSSSNKAKTLNATTVDAKYASTYNYAVEAASSIKTKIVPVPPPEVFEEIVRGKIQERREWEELMNRQYDVGSIIPELNILVNDILEDEEEYTGLNTTGATFNLAYVQEVKNRMDILSENYQRITTEHWSALRGSVALREQCDNCINSAMGKGQEWLNKHLDDETGISNATEYRDPIKSSLTDLVTKLEDVKALLSPDVIGVLEAESANSTESEDTES